MLPLNLLFLEDDESGQMSDSAIPLAFDECRSSDANKPRISLSDFKLLKVLGKGSFGKVCGEDASP